MIYFSNLINHHFYLIIIHKIFLIFFLKKIAENENELDDT